MLESLPRSVQLNLIDCITDACFDDQRFDAIVGEHIVGLSPCDKNKIINATYARYAAKRESESPGWCDR